MAGFLDKVLDMMRLGDDENIIYDNDEEDEIYEEEEEKFINKRSKSANVVIRNNASSKSNISNIEEEEAAAVNGSRPVKLKQHPSRQQSNQRQNGKQPVSHNSKVVPMRGGLNLMEVCVIKPSNIEDAREISDTLLSGCSVILNLEGLQVNIAQRIIDFTSGACYSINGNLKMVSNYIFIVTPEAVDISGDFKELFSNDNSSVDVSAFNATF